MPYGSSIAVSWRGAHLQGLAGFPKCQQAAIREPPHVIRHKGQQPWSARREAAHALVRDGGAVGDADALQAGAAQRDLCQQVIRHLQQGMQC